MGHKLPLHRKDGQAHDQLREDHWRKMAAMAQAASRNKVWGTGGFRPQDPSAFNTELDGMMVAEGILRLNTDPAPIRARRPYMGKPLVYPKTGSHKEEMIARRERQNARVPTFDYLTGERIER